jgi:hypothetical protein
VLYNAGLLAKIFPIQELPLLPLPAQPKELDAPVDEAKGEQIVIDAPQ